MQPSSASETPWKLICLSAPAARRSLLGTVLSAIVYMACASCPAESSAANDTPRLVELPNAGFESEALAWDLSAAQGTARVIPEAAVAGSKGLRIEAQKNDNGAIISSARLPVDLTLTYQLSWQARVLSGGGTNIYLRFFDANEKEIWREEGRVNADKGDIWRRYQLKAIPPAGATMMDVVVQRPGWRSPSYVVDLDAFELVASPTSVAAPWPGVYKLRPEDKDRLTEADIIGPDGRVYPDFTWAGVPGGIPNPPIKLPLEEIGAKPGMDISGLLETAADRVATMGGGVITIGEGEFYLDAPVMIYPSNVVIRGAGSGKTRLLFRYHIPYGEIRFFRLKPGQELGESGTIEFHTNPKDLVLLELRAGGKSLSLRKRQDHWGNTFALRVSANGIIGSLGEGTHTLTAIAKYADGKQVEQAIELKLRREAPAEPMPSDLGAVNFVGRGSVAKNIALTEDGLRGERKLKLTDNHGLTVGDKIRLVVPASERWKKLVGWGSHWEIQAQNLFEIVAVDGATVTIHQPLRVPYPLVDGPYVQKVRLIENSGLEGLYLEQIVVPNQGSPGPVISVTGWNAIEDLWTSGVNTHFAWGCWIKDVTVKNTGRNAAYFLMSKHIEIRDCVFDDALFKGGGGTGYVGFDRSWDCLMDNVEVKGMRHAPNCQWNASGNVIRNSRFEGSDGQWHAGWTHENLYENNFIDARGNGGSYGHGLYASGPTSGIHGPQGPRNVVYNNDIISKKDGLHMLGGNEGWLILYNRFVVGSGRAIFAKEKSFDHIIEGNVFVLRQSVSPTVLLGADSVGVELVNNAFYGTPLPLVAFQGGLTTLAVETGNTVAPEVPQSRPSRPEPKVPSIFQWQRDQKKSLPAKGDSVTAPIKK